MVAFMILCLATAIAVASLLAPGRVGRSSAYDQYLCTVCGLKRSDDIRRFGPVTYRNRVGYEGTALSRALGMTNCPHNWLLYRYGHSFHGLLVGSFIDGGCQSQAVPLLAGDPSFAQELAHLRSSGKTWGSLVAALNSSRAFDEAFLEWWQSSERGAFSNWAVTNGYWIPTTLK